MAKKKILVVDDEPQFLDMVKIRLEAGGYEVIAAANGKEALEAVKAESPDAVLMDILMPEMDGLLALQKIKEADKALPVFMITAFSNDERFEQAKKLGASGFIVKSSDLKKELGQVFAVLNIADKYRVDKKKG